MTPELRKNAAEALRRLQAAAEKAEAAAESISPLGAFGPLAFLGLAGVATAWVLGEDARDGKDNAREAARQTRKLADQMAAKLPTLTTDAQLRTFIRECGQYADISGLLTEVKQFTTATLVKEVAKPPPPPAGIPWGWIAGGAAALVGLVGAAYVWRTFAPPRRAAA